MLLAAIGDARSLFAVHEKRAREAANDASPYIHSKLAQVDATMSPFP